MNPFIAWHTVEVCWAAWSVLVDHSIAQMFWGCMECVEWTLSSVLGLHELCWLDPAWHTGEVCRATWSVLSVLLHGTLVKCVGPHGVCWLDPAWHTGKVCRAMWSSIGNGCQVRNICTAALLVRVYRCRPYLVLGFLV